MTSHTCLPQAAVPCWCWPMYYRASSTDKRVRTILRTLFPVGASPERSEQLVTTALLLTNIITAAHCALSLHACRHFWTVGSATAPMLTPTPPALLSRHQENRPVPLDWGAAAGLAAACCCGCGACSVESTLKAMRVVLQRQQRQGKHMCRCRHTKRLSANGGSVVHGVAVCLQYPWSVRFKVKTPPSTLFNYFDDQPDHSEKHKKAVNVHCTAYV
jgi:hypothetical protein